MPCQYNSVCVDQLNDYQCTCPDLYEGNKYGGKNCDVLLIGCDNNACQNGATCVPYLMDETQAVHNYTCECSPGYSGYYCGKTTTASFFGDTWLKYTGSDGSADISMQVNFATTLPSGLLLLNTKENSAETIDYMSLELKSETSLILKYKNQLISLKRITLSTLNDANLANGAWQKVNISVTYERVKLTLFHADCVNGLCWDSASLGTAGVTPLHHTLGDTYYGKNTAFLDQLPDDLLEIPAFVGCLQDLGIDSDVLLIEDYVEDETLSGNLASGCSRADQCAADPCNGQGDCTDLWFTYQCDCWRPYFGQNCSESKIFATLVFVLKR